MLCSVCVCARACMWFVLSTDDREHFSENIFQIIWSDKALLKIHQFVNIIPMLMVSVSFHYMALIMNEILEYYFPWLH